MLNKYSIKISIMITMGVFLYSACSERPIYHGKPGKEIDRKRVPKKKISNVRISAEFSPPVKNYSSKKITSGFGIRKNPKHNYKEFHSGIDIDTKMGESIVASAPGKIVYAGEKGGFGKIIIIEHGKRINTVYAHLSEIVCKMGDYVERGEKIGDAGKSGNATGTHLHFEIRKEGKAVNPVLYITS